MSLRERAAQSGHGRTPRGAARAIQIVKTWVAAGESHQRAYDVVGPAAEPATVDPLTCETSWTAHACNALAADARPATCDDAAVPKVLRERAWTSPIWFEPAL